MKLTRLLHCISSKNIPQPWKNAASVILAAPVLRDGNDIPCQDVSKNPSLNSSSRRNDVGEFDYRLLVLHRSAKSTFMPSAVVFPGGISHEIDSSPKWKEVYKAALGVSGDVTPVLEKLFHNLNGGHDRLPLFEQPVGTKTNLPMELISRLGAIRETFEESGVLLCCHNSSLNEEQRGSCIANLRQDDLSKWRQAVLNNEDSFVDMCLELELVPDIWSLNVWSNWLTPTNMTDKRHKSRRYDTVFYIACLNFTPAHLEDKSEIMLSLWQNPVEVLEDFKQKKIWLAPPQVYELSRLANFQAIDQLKNFAQSREKCGTKRWMPFRMNFKDAVLAALPGDDLYPEDLDVEGYQSTPNIDLSTEESRSASKHLNRFRITSSSGYKIVCNVENDFGHCKPKDFD